MDRASISGPTRRPRPAGPNGGTLGVRRGARPYSPEFDVDAAAHRPIAFRDCTAEIAARLAALEIPQALRCAGEALRAARGPAEAAEARYWMAKSHYVAGDIDIAIELAAAAHLEATEAGSAVLVSRVQTFQSRCLDAAGESQAALDCALMALQGLEGQDRADPAVRDAEQAAVTALGVVHLAIGELDAALQWCLRSVELSRGLQDQACYGAARDTLACVYAAQAGGARAAGRLDEAERLERLAIECSTEAVDVARRQGHVDYETAATLNLAESLTLVGEAARALDLLQSWAQRHPSALPRQWSHQRYALGLVLLAMDRPEEAVVAFEAAQACCEFEPHAASIAEQLSTALERCGRWAQALAQYKQFHLLHRRVTEERARRSARVAIARLDIERERARARQLSSTNAELRRRAEDLSRQAYEDALTGLPNRRRVEQLLLPWPQRIAVAMIDVDHFKQINDRHSHACGDAVLRRLAELMRRTTRPRDVAARWGGEEFVVLFAEAPDADVSAAAERLRDAVAQHDWSSIAAGLRVTVSLGLARANEVSSGPELLAAADRRLYLAKAAGRNRLVQAD